MSWLVTQYISRLAAGITSSATSFNVLAGTGSKFPTTYSFFILCETEIMACSNVTTDTLTVTRGQQGTTAVAHSINTLLSVAVKPDVLNASLYDAYSILMATSDNTPVVLTVAEQTLIGRITGGNIAALTGANALLAMGITPLVAELNYVDGVTSAIQGQIDLKAPIASPTFTGTVTLPAVTLGGAVAGGTQLVNNLGHVGINQPAGSTVAVYYAESLAIADDVVRYGFVNVLTASKTTAAYTGTLYGFYNNIGIEAANTQDWTNAQALVACYGTANCGAFTGTITGVSSFWAYASTAGGTITSYRGLYVTNPTGAGTITRAYGVYIENITKGGTLNYAIYSAGGLVYFAGNTSIGGTLSVTGDIDGATLDTCVGKGTWTASGTWTLPAVTFSGLVSFAAWYGFISTVDNAYVAVKGGTAGAGSSAFFTAWGKSASSPGAFIFYTPNAAGTADVARLTISGVLATAIATWSNITHTDFNLGDYIGLYQTDVDSAVKAEVWYDASENVLKYFNGTVVKTIATV